MATTPASPDLEQFYEELEGESLQGLWRVVRGMISHTPTSPAVPHHWRWETLRAMLFRATELINIQQGGGDRRVIMLVNPGLKARYFTTPTLAASVQIIKPGEVAPAHRHSATAIRFIVEGSGAFSAVNGERIHMEERDLILTPSMSWHNHGNETGQPVLWVDALDAPLMNYLCTFFYDDYPQAEHEIVRPTGYTAKKFGARALRPSAEQAVGGVSPLWHYRWADTYPALQDLAAVDMDPFDGAMLDYINPLTGKHALPSMACRIQLLPAGLVTRPHRHTGHFVYHVVQGSGATTIDGVRYDWKQGDFFLVPPWAAHQHESGGREDAILFSLSDIPLLDALGLYKEQAVEDAPAPELVEGRAMVTV
jgi:gentisate 1,2-dioxygenase